MCFILVSIVCSAFETHSLVSPRVLQRPQIQFALRKLQQENAASSVATAHHGRRLRRLVINALTIVAVGQHSLLPPGFELPKIGPYSLDSIYRPGYPCKVLLVIHALVRDAQMAHTIEHKKKPLNRVHRIMGQVAAIEKTLEQEGECSEVLHNIAGCRGAMDALMAEVIDGHIRRHIFSPDGRAMAKQKRAADDLVAALHAYLK